MPECASCGKKTYTSRRQAKKIAHKLYPGDHLRAYRCVNGLWHIGHLPSSVLKGKKSSKLVYRG